jgi:hypothetical protein
MADLLARPPRLETGSPAGPSINDRQVEADGWIMIQAGELGASSPANTNPPACAPADRRLEFPFGRNRRPESPA